MVVVVTEEMLLASNKLVADGDRSVEAEVSVNVVSVRAGLA